MIEFKVGDKVRAPTIEPDIGIVTDCPRHPDDSKPLLVRFGSGICWWFTLDGRFHPGAPEPALILVERPKAKRKVKVERWVSVFHHPELSYEFSCCIDTTEEAAFKNNANEPTFIKTVKFETEVEIEE